MTRRDYYKCTDCLVAVAIDGDIVVDVACVCGGKLKRMGEVQRHNVVHTEEHPPCDERCTNARGPKCDCQCGAVNHGTGRVVTVEIVDGKARMVTSTPAEQLKHGTAYRASVEAVLAAARARPYFHAYEMYSTGVYNPDYTGYSKATAFIRAFTYARGLGTNSGRRKALEDLQARVARGELL